MTSDLLPSLALGHANAAAEIEEHDARAPIRLRGITGDAAGSQLLSQQVQLRPGSCR